VKIPKEGKIKLRRFRKSDKARLAKLANNLKIWDNAMDFFPHPYSESDAESFITLTSKEEPEVTFGIEYEDKLCAE